MLGTWEPLNLFTAHTDSCSKGSICSNIIGLIGRVANIIIIIKAIYKAQDRYVGSGSVYSKQKGLQL